MRNRTSPRPFRTPVIRPIYRVAALLLTFIYSAPPRALTAEPAWWAERSVFKRDANTGEIPSADNYAVINQGQLKNLAISTYEELYDQLSGNTSTALRNLIGAWVELESSGEVKRDAQGRRIPKVTQATDDFAVVNLAQLKATAKPFYVCLAANGLTLPLPWAGSPTPADDRALANIGQAKRVFALDLAHDTDGDGMSDLLEFQNHTNPNSMDSDGDGIKDGEEYFLGSDPLNSDEDMDGVLDGSASWAANRSDPQMTALVTAALAAPTKPTSLPPAADGWPLPHAYSKESNLRLYAEPVSGGTALRWEGPVGARSQVTIEMENEANKTWTVVATMPYADGSCTVPYSGGPFNFRLGPAPYSNETKPKAVLMAKYVAFDRYKPGFPEFPYSGYWNDPDYLTRPFPMYLTVTETRFEASPSTGGGGATLSARSAASPSTDEVGATSTSSEQWANALKYGVTIDPRARFQKELMAAQTTYESSTTSSTSSSTTKGNSRRVVARVDVWPSIDSPVEKYRGTEYNRGFRVDTEIALPSGTLIKRERTSAHRTYRATLGESEQTDFLTYLYSTPSSGGTEQTETTYKRWVGSALVDYQHSNGVPGDGASINTFDPYLWFNYRSYRMALT